MKNTIMRILSSLHEHGSVCMMSLRWLHVHANVAIAEIESWTKALRSTLLRLMREEAGQQGWTVEVRPQAVGEGGSGNGACTHLCAFDLGDGM